jgi:hypothetical protein
MAPLTFAYDYNQLYLYDPAVDRASADNVYLDALAAATEAGLTVGARSGIVDVLMPRQENFGATVEVRVLAAEPELRATADHIVEFDLRISSGRLVLEGSGGAGTLEVDVPAAHYRARLTGEEFESAASWRYEDEGDPGDRYLLELWPTTIERPPSEVRRWAGYADRV